MRTMTHLLILLVGLIILNPAASEGGRENIITFNDILEISVYDHPDLTTTARVDGKGMVILPLLKEVSVQGMTVSEASEHIANLLDGDWIIDPQVSVFVTNFREQKASILGQVVRPGIYELTGSTTLLELISQAGGLTVEAGERATINRDTDNGDGTELKIALRRLIDQGDVSLNLPILDGDKVFIDRAGKFYVTGEVMRPDGYVHQDNLTVMKAIAEAGGFKDTAAKGKVKIVRKKEGKEEVISSVGMDDLVQPDDVVVVPKSFF